MKVFLLFSYLKQKLRFSNENKINFNPSRRDKIYSENYDKNKKQENVHDIHRNRTIERRESILVKSKSCRFLSLQKIYDFRQQRQTSTNSFIIYT